MTDILIVHLEGNINANAFLNGAVRILCRLGHRVTVVSRKQAYAQSAPCEGCDLVLFEDDEPALPDRRWACVIGVDAHGIEKAAPFARRLGARLGLISFEIFFEGEVGAREKLGEILACRDLDFAVAQDDVRATMLQHENHIPRDKIITIPLASAGALPRAAAPGRLHALHDLPPGTRIALMAGSFSNWSGAAQLLESAAVWPDDWRILIHARHGLPADDRELLKLNDPAGRFLISESRFADMDDLSELTDQVDLGLALYHPTFDGRYYGNNLKYLGMASGKISTYLRHGLPVLCNRIGTMSEEIEKHRLGFSVFSMAEIPRVLEGYRREDHEPNCLAYFRARLDLDRTIGPFLDAVLGRRFPG